MASRHPRVQVPVDPEVAEAIARGRRVVGENAPASRVLRTLALRGAEALEADGEAGRAASDFLVRVAQGSSGLDLDALRTTRSRAWR
ncbi:hypothetical protein BH20ACT16_BH20ACT16_03940 [soil metagenome]|jgi:hypothetical protein